MPEGMGYPKGKGILGKVSQGDLGADVAKRSNDKLEINVNQKIKQGEFGADVAKRPNEKLNMNPNQKVKQGDLGSESGSVGKKEKVDASIFNKANEKDY